MNETPLSLGYKRSPEWEEHAATWISWPQLADDWVSFGHEIRVFYLDLIREIAEGEWVNIFVDTPAIGTMLLKQLDQSKVNIQNCSCIPIPTNRTWTRDSGPIFVMDTAGQVAICDFLFNAWGEKYPDYQFDDDMALQVSQLYNYPRFVPSRNRYVASDINAEYRERLVLEGGAFEVNSDGLCLVTEECLLDQNTQVRNPGFDKEMTETFLRDYLGVRKIIWLGNGISGDDTHGHIDDFCRFVNDNTVVIAQEENQNDINFDSLQENKSRLRQFDIIDLPMPGPCYFGNLRLPASYANYYICNAAVLVPIFDDPKDKQALGILSECFPDKKVVGISSNTLIIGQGGIHCITNDEPAG